MNNYFNTFQNITQSVEQLLNDEHNSLEIEQSARSLSNSVQSCIEELKQSATRLKRLVLVCSDELHHAENIWLSKPKIAEAVKHEIWEQLGEISGRSIRIRHLGSQCKDEAVNQANKSWEKRIDYLRTKYFENAQGQPKTGIGWDEKNNFITEVKLETENQSEELNEIIKEKLNLVFKEIKNIQLKSLEYCVSLLNQQKTGEVSKQIDLISSEIQTKFGNFLEHLPKYTLVFKTTVKPDLLALVEQGWGDISWEDVVNFKEKVASKIEKYITAIIDYRVKLVTEAIAKAIAFYNYFLEQQKRYQQETPEQRKAEKAWIEQQRQELARVQDSIEVILNAS